MHLKTKYRRVAAYLERALDLANKAQDQLELREDDKQLLSWIEEGEDLWEKYCDLRDDTPAKV